MATPASASAPSADNTSAAITSADCACDSASPATRRASSRARPQRTRTRDPIQPSLRIGDSSRIQLTMWAAATLTLSILHSLLALFSSRRDQALVELALRQQLAVYARRHRRPRLSPLDRAFWVALVRLWPRRKQALVIVSPTAQWVSQQLLDAFPEAPHRFLIYDNDAIFCDATTQVIESLGLHPQRTAFQSPWQTGQRNASSAPFAGSSVIM